MRTAYLIDSNVLIRACYPDTPEQKFITKHLSGGNLHISALNIAEVLVGASNEETQRLEAVFAHCHVHEVDEVIARDAAVLRKQKLKSTKVFLLDCCIAATALQIGAAVVTSNTKDFIFKGLKTISPSP